MQTNLYIGIDFGTSGVRSVVIDDQEQVQGEVKSDFPQGISGSEWLEVWKTSLWKILAQIPQELRQQTQGIAIDGTSATVLLCDRWGTPIDEPILYNDSPGARVLERLNAIAPPHHPVMSATSSLAKLLGWLTIDVNWSKFSHPQPIYFLHQADWLGFLLHGKLGISDYHNALKLGYDVAHLSYPHWLINGLHPVTRTPIPQLPKIVAPGTPIGGVTPEIANRFNFPPQCQVCAGTTDSIAAFLASGVQTPGEAVTSLGSTLVLKLLSQTRVDDARYGIYSHRFGDLWLTGGASNTGGAVLRHYFQDHELETLSREINPQTNSGLKYYPLLKKGDRFPTNDPELLPQLQPRPTNPVDFLKGLLEGIARIENQGYSLLQQLGATPLKRVYTAGGGAKNPTWTAIRQRYLNVPVLSAQHTDAAYGAALLGKRSLEINIKINTNKP